MCGKNSKWRNRGNKAMHQAPIANRAKNGGPNRKANAKLQARIKAWQAPESKQFQNQVAAGGAKCPGSLQFH